jgi:hypothetical protein
MEGLQLSMAPDEHRKESSPMAKGKVLRQGTPAPKSGQYKIPGSSTEVTVVEKKPLPPTPKPGQGYVIVDPTKHKKSR